MVHLVMVQSQGFLLFVEWAKNHGASYFDKVYQSSFKKAIDQQIDVKQLAVDLANEQNNVGFGFFSQKNKNT